MIKARLHILVYADVDMNLTDGSSIWLNSIVQVLARDSSAFVHVLLKSRIRKELLLEDLYKLKNIRLTDPFRHFTGYPFRDKNRLVPDDAINLIGKLTKENYYNCLILRGAEICKKAAVSLDHAERIIPYITGFTNDPDRIGEEEKETLSRMYGKVRLMFLQTEEMKSAFLGIIKTGEDKIAVLPPMVADFPEEEPSFRNINNALVYVGKFSNDYYLYESLQAFKKTGNAGYKFYIAGDKFHLDLKVPKEELIKMMENIPGVDWKKALNREEVSRLIRDSDLGLCWRSETIDNERSMELSTKLLEYGRLGKPVLVRRIPIHERLLGVDYPFYVDSEEDLIQKIRLAFSNSSLYEKAARKLYSVSNSHSFSNISMKIRPFLEVFASEVAEFQQEKKLSGLKKFFKEITGKLSGKS
jgi:hypothetical protein